MKERMKRVSLEGVAGYLGSGAPRFTHEHIRETYLRDDAFDAGNVASNFKSRSHEVSGNKDTGHTLNN